MKIPEGLKSSISSKVLGKAKDVASKVSGSSGDNATLKVIAKNFMSIPSMARDINVARQNVTKLVKLEGGKPATGADMWFKKSKQNEEKLESELKKNDEEKIKSKTPQAVKKPESSKFSKLTALLKVGAVILALSQIPGGFIKNIFDGIVDSIKELAISIWEEITTAFTGFVDQIKKWFKDIVQPILDELKIFLQAVWAKITDFFKPIFNWVGDKIKTIIEFLQPVFDFMKSVFDKVMQVLSPLKSVYDSLLKNIEFAKNALKEAEAKSAKAEAPPGYEYDAEGGLQESAESRQAKSRAEKAKADADAKSKTEAAAKKKQEEEANKKKTLPDTGAGGGRGKGGPSAADIAKKDLTPSQLKWLGNADPTDPYIMARMPPPQPGEKGGPPAPVKPSPAPVAPKPPPAPAPAPVPAPAVKVTPTPAPAPAAPAQKPVPVLPEKGLVGQIVESLKQSGIVSVKAIANILATIKAETNFKVRSEDLYYKSPEQIQKTFGKIRIPSLDFAQQFVKNPEALANEVYKNTDGNKEPGDGYKFRGRGFIQHTGRNQYEGIKKFTGIDVVSNPDLLNDPVVATKALAWFFLSYKKQIIKKPEDLENMSTVNKAVGFADTTGEKAVKRIASAEQITSSISSGQNIDSLSGLVAADQRKQAKPNTPIVVNAPTTNTTNVVKNETKTASTSQANQTLLARAT